MKTDQMGGLATPHESHACQGCQLCAEHGLAGLPASLERLHLITPHPIGATWSMFCGAMARRAGRCSSTPAGGHTAHQRHAGRVTSPASVHDSRAGARRQTQPTLVSEQELGPPAPSPLLAALELELELDAELSLPYVLTPLPAGGLPPLGALRVLRLRSRVPEAPEPLDPDEPPPPDDPYVSATKKALKRVSFQRRRFHA
jgi:hypothetical protein